MKRTRDVAVRIRSFTQGLGYILPDPEVDEKDLSGLLRPNGAPF